MSWGEEMLKVSVIIATYKREEELQRALESLTTQN